MSAVALSPVELVFSDGESAMTDSLKVAKAFNKRHADVIRAVENLESSDGFAKLNFELCYENNDLQNGKPRKFYRITEEGAMFLIMRFTGKAAAMVQESFILAFSHMRKQLLAYKQYGQLCAQYDEEKQEASFCGRGLNRWKVRKKVFEFEIPMLEKIIQPDLFINNHSAA